MTDNPVEFPQALRDVSERNLKQARAAYEQLTDFVTKAMDAWMGAMPSPMASFPAVAELLFPMSSKQVSHAGEKLCVRGPALALAQNSSKSMICRAPRSKVATSSVA